MESDKEIWVEKTLISLDGIQRAVPTIGLQARIMQRIKDERFRIIPETVHPATIYRAAAAILLIVATNVFTCIAFSKSVTEKKELTSFAKEYSLTESNDSFINI